MTDREHSAVQSMQATHSDTVVDRTEAQARAAQLIEIHHPVLGRGEPRDPRVRACPVANVLHADT